MTFALQICIGFVIFSAVFIVGNLALHRARLEMAHLGEAMISDSRASRDNREKINILLDSCMSFRVGLMLPFAILACIFDDLLQNQPVKSKLSTDPRYHAFVARYFVSILACNPIAASVSLPLLALGFVVHKISRGEKMSAAAEETIEEALVRASPLGSFSPA